MKTKNTTDITNLSDAALDAFLDVKAGVDFVDASNLTMADRYEVAVALGWEMNARTRAWISGPDSNNAPSGPRRISRDVEAMILEEQEDEGRNVG